MKKFARAVVREGSLNEGPALADAPIAEPDPSDAEVVRPQAANADAHAFVSFRTLWEMLGRRWRFCAIVLGSAVLACLSYWLIAPDQYEAVARVTLRTTPLTTLSVDGSAENSARQFLTGDLQLETLANELRSNQLAWRVICEQSLFRAPGFLGPFGRRLQGLDVKHPPPEIQAHLLERFQKHLSVRTIPRTLIIEIRFRSKDPVLSASVANGLIRAYAQQDSATRVVATAEATAWLTDQLHDLKNRVEQDDRRLMDFQRSHVLIGAPETLPNGQLGDASHNVALTEVDDLGRELVVATSERILREAEYRAASEGNPELVVASDPDLRLPNTSFATAVLQQLHSRRSDLEQEASQLRIEHGPNFPRAVEIQIQLSEIDRQIAGEDARLVEQFKGAWQSASSRENLVRQALEQSTNEAMRVNEAATQYAFMRAEANRNHDLLMRVEEKAQEAGLTAGVNGSRVAVVDPALQPVKPVSPNLPLDLAGAVFVGAWVAFAGALLLESLSSTVTRKATLTVLLAVMCGFGRAQAPTPSTSGLPTGVARIPQSSETRSVPNAKEAPAVWSNARNETVAALPGSAASPSIAAPLGPGDVVEISEFHTPEFRTVTRVSEAGTLELPLVGEVQVSGLTEHAAARAIEQALIGRGMLLHPQVTVLVTVFVGEDVTVLGEVTHPGVYPLAAHHRLFDLISAASGFGPAAGSLITITHRDESKPPQALVLDRSNLQLGIQENPELEAGDTVQVNRAGLVYIVGAVIRPGGFPLDPSQHLTVVQAVTLAWGPAQSASLTKALLIREQKGGRTLTQLNLKRLLRGQDPDLPIQDRDIIFVPDSAAKNLWNRSLESVVQSAAGVSIYAGMVYSQRF